MAVTIASGLVDTSVPTSNELKIDMREKITYLDPDTTQFSTMLMKLPQEKAKSFKVEWLEDRLMPRTSALAATAASADTALTVTTNEGSYFKAGDVVRNTLTGDAFRVTAATASALTVVRGIGGTTAASSASSATSGQLVIVNNINAQGATLPTALATKRSANYNYTSITRNSARFTETALATDWYGGDLLEDKEVMKKGVEHKTDIEDGLFFGARSYSASSPPLHSAGGLFEYISTNVHSATALDKGTLNDWLRTDLQYGSNKKVLFASPIIAQVLSEFLQDNWVRSPQDLTLWGVKVNALISAVYGTDIPVIVKRQWGGLGSTTATGSYASFAFLVDMENVQFAPLRTTQLKRDRQARDADEQAVEYITEYSLKVEREETHALWKNVQG